ncbi:MAG: hypothetical protein J07HX5_01824 [halophilic archaeon J07HX5]|jgi:hypothetical protein|nr:MAG: hypothetical protein J07HX5_01824 [halophilic archaeon J07HX5]
MSSTVPVEDVRPTQLYLSTAKLIGVLDWFDPDDPNYNSLPAFRYDQKWHLSDGHTRAFVAALTGADRLCLTHTPVQDEDAAAVYRAAIEWCREADIEKISDLHGRLVGPETYEQLWIERCQQVTDDTA